MPAELVVLAVFLAAALLFAVPRITRLPGLPLVLRFEEVPDSGLSTAQSAYLGRLDAAVAGLHYRPVFNIRVANLPSANLSRFYTSDAGPALLLTSLLSVQGPRRHAHNVDYVEMITRYRDGTALTTSNSTTTSPFARLPKRVTQHFPGLDPLRLKERHDQAAAGLADREALWHARENILERWQESHREWCEHQARVGLLRLDARTASYRPATAVALRGIVKFLNPLGGQVTPLRLLAAILLGSVVPSAALLALRDAAPSTVASAAALVHLPAALAGTIALVALLVVAGAVAGRVFGRQKYFVGALVVGLMPALVLARSSLVQPLLALLIIEWTARQTSAWINRRRRLL